MDNFIVQSENKNSGLIISMSILDKEFQILSSWRYKYTFSTNSCFEKSLEFKGIMSDGSDK